MNDILDFNTDLDFYAESAGQGTQVTTESTRFKRKKPSVLLQKTTVYALAIAKQKKDPLFDKFIFHRQKMREFKATIMKKYGSAGKVLARKSK